MDLKEDEISFTHAIQFRILVRLIQNQSLTPAE